MVRSSLTSITRYLRRLPGLLAALALSAAMSIVLDAVQLRQAQPPMPSLPVIVIMHLFLVGVLAAALGWTAGLVAALASAMFIDLLFIAPRLSLAVAQAEDMALLVLFLSVSLVNVPLLGRVQSSLRDARARQRELTHLYELITALAGQRRESAIARTLAGHLREALQAQCVEVVIQPDPKRAAVIVCAPEDAAPNGRPDDVVPLMTLRGLLGEIHLWRSATAPPSAWSEQLIRAAAGQAALAIERAALAEAETRAQVLEESDRMKTVLLSSVSHELRTPLATIKAAVSSLRSGAVSWDAAARHELLAVVEEETDQLNHLVGNLLEMSRIEAGALKPQRQWNVLADILHQTLRRLQRASARHHFEIDVSEDLPLVPVDDAQIGQVFANLIGNCLKYAPPDTTIAIRAEVKSDHWLMVSIANQGPQVPAQDLERIFDKFHRVTAADRITGAGLGLSICKGIIEAHGGRIWAENLPASSQFTFAFHFTLPLTLDGARQRRLPQGTE